MKYAPAIQSAVDRLRKLPGLGTRSAERVVFHLLAVAPRHLEELIEALTDLRERVGPCGRCGNLSESDPCPICRDERRDPSVICVVEHPSDLYAIERAGQFRGHYHVLGGVLSPIAGVGPDDLQIPRLVQRAEAESVSEIIVATNPSTEGEATALYLVRVFHGRDVKVSRIAHGIPVGGHLGYVDDMTMGKAFEGRRVLSE